MNDNFDKCIAAYLRYRYFPKNLTPFSDKPTFELNIKNKTRVSNQFELNNYLYSYFKDVDFCKTGIMLSGGIDSALLASYCPKGTIAFTLSYPEQPEIDEVEQAKKYAEKFNLKLVVVPVTWEDVINYHDDLILHKRSPINAIEIGIYKMCLFALDYGLENLITGMGADVLFGGLYNIMSKKWSNNEFIDRFTHVVPNLVMKSKIDCLDYFTPYFDEPYFSTYRFLEDIFSSDTVSSFLNPVTLCGLNLLAPYESLQRGFDLNLEDMVNGKEKKILHDLFYERVGEFFVPRKYPLPRPLSVWKTKMVLNNFDYWSIPSLECVSSNENKWILFSADRFVTLFKNKCFNHYETVYTTGVYDMFHIGHLTILRRAKSICNHLIVGVTSDDLVSYKNKSSIIKYEDRVKIIRSLPFVEKAVEQFNMDKLSACLKYKANAVVVGDDWKGTEKWIEYEKILNKHNIDVVYFPYTKRVSSTMLRDDLMKKNKV